MNHQNLIPALIILLTGCQTLPLDELKNQMLLISDMRKIIAADCQLLAAEGNAFSVPFDGEFLYEETQTLASEPGTVSATRFELQSLRRNQRIQRESNIRGISSKVYQCRQKGLQEARTLLLSQQRK